MEAHPSCPGCFAQVPAQNMVMHSMRCPGPSPGTRTGFYTHADGQRELVRVVTAHAAGEGGGFTIFIPSLGRERNTVPDKLEIVGGGAEKLDATAAAESV